MSTTKLARTLEQWRNCEPEAMATMSLAAIEYALKDAKHDILALAAISDAAQAPQEPEFMAWRRGVREAFDVANMINANRHGMNTEETLRHMVRKLADLANGGEEYAAPVAPAAAAPSDDARNLVTLDRHDLWDYVRGAIYAALHDKIPKDCVVSWAWVEATNRTMDIFQKIVDATPTPTVAADTTAPCTECGGSASIKCQSKHCPQAAQPDERAACDCGVNCQDTGEGNCRYLDIVFDGPPSHESGRFVEVEDAEGRSVNAGEWIDRGNGLWAIRIARATAPQATGKDDFGIDDCIEALVDAKSLAEKFSARNQLDLAINREIEARAAVPQAEAALTDEQILVRCKDHFAACYVDATPSAWIGLARSLLTPQDNSPCSS